jgi:hypothetical protein
MTSIDALSLGTHAMLGLSLGILITLVARSPVLHVFGPQIAYTLRSAAYALVSRANMK